MKQQSNETRVFYIDLISSLNTNILTPVQVKIQKEVKNFEFESGKLG